MRQALDDLKDIYRVFPRIAEGEAQELWWRGVIDICNENDLSFMIGEARVDTEAQYNTGTVAVTSGTPTVTLTGGTWVNTWTNRRIQIQGRQEFYDVQTIANPTITLTENWRGSTGSGLSYLLYRDVYSMPTDCEMSKELLIADMRHRWQIEFVDYGEFRLRKRQLGAVIAGDPWEVTRLGLTAAGVPQLEFGPWVPAGATTYNLDYYRSPQKPTALTQSLSPAWPEAFSDVRVLRALWKYADRTSHVRRFEFEQQYRRRIFEMNAKFDGGNEMRRRIRGTRPREGANRFGSLGMNVIAGNYSK